MSQPSFGQSLKRVWTQWDFVIVAVVLLVAAVGLNVSVNMLKLYFRKEPVSLRQDLSTKDRPLNAEIEDVLKTDKYVFRDYVDDKVVPKEVIAQIQEMGDAERG